MIVYRAATRLVHATDVFDLAVFDSHAKRRRFLIHFGELEAALADEGHNSDTMRRYREVSMLAGELFCRPICRCHRTHARIARAIAAARPSGPRLSA